MTSYPAYILDTWSLHRYYITPGLETDHVRSISQYFSVRTICVELVVTSAEREEKETAEKLNPFRPCTRQRTAATASRRHFEVSETIETVEMCACCAGCSQLPTVLYMIVISRLCGERASLGFDLEYSKVF